MAIEKPRILIVDDEPEACRLFSMMLALQGFRTEIASNGLEALSRVRRDPPDLVFLDVMLPGVDGLSVCRELRSNGETRDLAIVLVSGHADTESMRAGLDAGADAYLVKPVALDEVLQVIRRVLVAHGATV